MNKKEQIVNLATNFIKEYSFPDLSYDYLAKKLEITKTAIHYYFKNKKDLGVAICEGLENGLKRQLDDFQKNKEKEPWEFIRERISFLNEGEVCPIASMQSDFNEFDDELKQKIIELADLEYAVYVKILSRTIDSVTAEKYAQIHLSALKGAQFYDRSISIPFYKNILMFIQEELENRTKKEGC